MTCFPADVTCGLYNIIYKKNRWNFSSKKYSNKIVAQANFVSSFLQKYPVIRKHSLFKITNLRLHFEKCTADNFISEIQRQVFDKNLSSFSYNLVEQTFFYPFIKITGTYFCMKARNMTPPWYVRTQLSSYLCTRYTCNIGR